MKKVLFPTLALATLLIAGCANAVEEQKAAPIAFETYVQRVEAETSTGFPVSMDLCLDMPVGDGEQQENVKKGITEVIGLSAIGKVLGAPTGNTMKEIGDNYVSIFKQKTDANTISRAITMQVSCVYQNEACAVFYVEDDGIDYDSSQKYEAVIRLSDGHPMTNDEIAKISKDELMNLAHKFADDSQKGEIDDEGNYSLSIGADGLLFHPTQYSLNEYVLPIEAVEAYLTEDGKALLKASPLLAERPGSSETIQGDLGRYDLQGPVKSYKIVSEDIEYTFDTNGLLQTRNGEPVVGSVYEKINRNDQGLATEAFAIGNSRDIFTYDASGRLAKRVYRVGNRDEQIDVYYYDSRGVLYKVNSMTLLNERNIVTNTEKFYGFQFDSHGNWIKRGRAERVITYYN